VCLATGDQGQLSVPAHTAAARRHAVGAVHGSRAAAGALLQGLRLMVFASSARLRQSVTHAEVRTQRAGAPRSPVRPPHPPLVACAPRTCPPCLLLPCASAFALSNVFCPLWSLSSRPLLLELQQQPALEGVTVQMLLLPRASVFTSAGGRLW